MKKLLMAATAVASMIATPAMAGNGAPSGQHYTLNIIGVDANQDRPDRAAGHVIFVDLTGMTKINLAEGDFKVLDKDGTDGTAAFQLPNPDPDGDGTTAYSVYARALGKPGGSAKMQTCFYDEETATDYCSMDDDGSDVAVNFIRSKGKSTFTNVSKELLFIYADTDGDGNVERYSLFSDEGDSYWWEYTNSGLRLAQLRFYDCSTTVGDDPSDPISTNC